MRSVWRGLKDFTIKHNRWPWLLFLICCLVSSVLSSDIDLKEAQRFFAQKFSCGASVTAEDEIIIQGDFTDDIIDVIQEKWPEVTMTRFLNVCLLASQSSFFFSSFIPLQRRSTVTLAFFHRWTTTASTTSEKSRSEKPTCTFTATDATRHDTNKRGQTYTLTSSRFISYFIYCIERGGLGHTLGAFFLPSLLSSR